MASDLRAWQQECEQRASEVWSRGEKAFIFEACMASGKSRMAARLAHRMINKEGCDHVLAAVPWKSVQGDTNSGMMKAFFEEGLDPRSSFFQISKRQPHQPIPHMGATVTLYHEICCQQTIDTINMWASMSGFRFGLICDEIHHTSEQMGSSWGNYISELHNLAHRASYMSGTFFRGDGRRVSPGFIPYDAQGRPVKHYAYTYDRGIADGVVRAVAFRRLEAHVKLYDAKDHRYYERDLSKITKDKEITAAKGIFLDPDSDWMCGTIKAVHNDLELTRNQFPGAGCLYVCPPGFYGDELACEGSEEETRYVHAIARKIREITGIEPIVLTHKDKDAQGKLAQFRSGLMPYLVAVNMVSEGCDLPRLRQLCFLRYTDSEMLFRQIVGRILRVQYEPSTKRMLEDGTAALVHYPPFPLLEEFVIRMRKDADDGSERRVCKKCNRWPCICIVTPPLPCSICGQRPCICPPCPVCGHKPCRCSRLPPEVEFMGADLNLEGGYHADFRVMEHYIRAADVVHRQNPKLTPSNMVQLGAHFQLYETNRQNGFNETAVKPEPKDRSYWEKQVVKLIGKIVQIRCRPRKPESEDYQEAWVNEVQQVFNAKWQTEIKGIWKTSEIEEIAHHLEKRIKEIIDHASQ